MFNFKKRDRAAMFFSAVTAIFTGVAAGALFPCHFQYARFAYFISLFVAAVLWLRILKAPQCRCTPGVRGIGLAAFSLFGSSVIGIIICDAHTLSHAILFGINAALLVFLLLRSIYEAEIDRRGR